MANIKLISEQEANPEVRELFDDIKTTLGLDFVPNTYRAMAHKPDHLRQTWARVKYFQQSPNWNPTTLSMVGLAVSILNSCHYCVDFHTARLQQHGLSPQQLQELVQYIGLASELNQWVTGMNLESDVRPAQWQQAA